MRRHPAPCCALSAVSALLLLCACSREESSSDFSDAAMDAPADAVSDAADADPVFLGRDSCASCHEDAFDAHAGSHHDLAMQQATPETVLGDFADAAFEHFGVRSRFFTRDSDFFVETNGPDGALREYQIAYTFGVEPLQQYLVAFPGGRLQVLPLCWDTRPETDGGQRWFHIYPDEAIPADDELHWTGPNQNWNFMCAECHSTDLHKGYDPATDTYETTWAEIDVSCEACHGPGSGHVAWAKRTGESPEYSDALEAGLVVDLSSRDEGRWTFAPDAPTARRSVNRQSRTEIESCARCHARRVTLTDAYQHGSVLLETHRLSLLTDPEYFADGQVLEEDYVYGSFLQSRMYAEGVTCTDCHDPHTARVRLEGDGLCFRCHQPRVFGAESHSRHPVEYTPGTGTGKASVSCIECHMPVRTYMVVDDRHDHSFRVPRPDLSAQLGTPNACNACHADESAEWAAEHITAWFGKNRRQEWHFGEALHAGRTGKPGAAEALTKLSRDTKQPGIARATGLGLLAQYPGAAQIEAIRTSVADDDPLVRLGALAALTGVAPAGRLELAGGLLHDPVLAVRAEAARVLASSVTEASPLLIQQAFEAAAADFVATQSATAERPESHINLGVFLTNRDRPDEAEREYRRALALDPANIPASINLADLYRIQGRDAEGEQILREALKREPRSAAARHALGLVLIRLGQHEEALAELERAAEWGPEVARHAYVYAVALDSMGKPERALRVMRAAHDKHPFDRDTLAALVGMCRQRGLIEEADRYARLLTTLAEK